MLNSTHCVDFNTPWHSRHSGAVPRKSVVLWCSCPIKPPGRARTIEVSRAAVSTSVSTVRKHDQILLQRIGGTGLAPSRCWRTLCMLSRFPHRGCHLGFHGIAWKPLTLVARCARLAVIALQHFLGQGQPGDDRSSGTMEYEQPRLPRQNRLGRWGGF